MGFLGPINNEWFNNPYESKCQTVGLAFESFLSLSLFPYPQAVERTLERTRSSHTARGRGSFFHCNGACIFTLYKSSLTLPLINYLHLTHVFVQLSNCPYTLSAFFTLYNKPLIYVFLSHIFTMAFDSITHLGLHLLTLVFRTDPVWKSWRKMALNGVFDLLQENVKKPRFCKSLPLGENWKSKSMVI